jgi:hypothetical protein
MVFYGIARVSVSFPLSLSEAAPCPLPLARLAQLLQHGSQVGERAIDVPRRLLLRPAATAAGLVHLCGAVFLVENF